MKNIYFLLTLAYCSVALGLTKDDSVDLTNILSDVSQLKSGLLSTTTALQKTIDDLEATKAELQETKAQLALKTKDVSFHAHMSGQYLSTEHQPLKFNSWRHNTGSYNSTTGKFTAPVNGTYIFSAAVEMGGGRQQMYIYIRQTGAILSSGIGVTSPNIDIITIPVTAITNMRQGEEVWVTTQHTVELYAYGATRFAGALLSAD